MLMGLNRHVPAWSRLPVPVTQRLLVVENTPPKDDIRELTKDEMPRLAAALGDSPETVISWDILASGTGRAWLAGEIDHPRAAVIQANAMPDEPVAFGTDADAIARIAPMVGDGTWTAFLVPTGLARALERPLATAAGTLSITTLEDVYHVLDRPLAPVWRQPTVRLLTRDDAALIGGGEAFEAGEHGEMIAAAAIVDGEIVSLAHTFAWSPKHADIGVSTHEDHRGLGYATSAAALVAEQIVRRGHLPVWSCGAHNEPSMAIARRLGFRETSRKLYIVPQRKEDAAGS